MFYAQILIIRIQNYRNGSEHQSSLVSDNKLIKSKAHFAKAGGKFYGRFPKRAIKDKRC